MGYEIVIAFIACGMLSGFICYEAGYLRGMIFAEKNYEEAMQMSEHTFELQDRTIQTYRETVNELRAQLYKLEDEEGKDENKDRIIQ